MTNAAESPQPAPVELTLGRPFTLGELDGLYERPLRVRVSAEARKRVEQGRREIESLLSSGRVIYGVNTGFGKLCNVRISADQLSKLQENLLLSHAVGVGSPAPAAVVRWMLLFKIHALLAGASGVQPSCIDALCALLNHDILPVVPSRGSLGASGDLAPLAHLVLPLIGHGEVWFNGERLASETCFQHIGLEPIRLGAKDGLALINGTQFMLAYGAAIAVRAARLAKQADVIASMTLEAYRGSIAPFHEGLNALRPHPGMMDVAANIRRLMADSAILASHANCGKVQDPYSLRCVASVHGACRGVLNYAAKTLEIELNSVTDNPVLIGGDVFSGGLFHGEPLAFALDHLATALTEWANISERRIYLLLPGPDGLPPLLMKETGLNSGFMIPQYTAAALVNECKVLSTPACVDSIPSSLGQEDHVSMGATSAVKCWQIMDHVETVLAIELLCAAQGLDYRLPTQPGIGPRTALEVVRRSISHAEEDREFGRDIQASLAILREGAMLRAVETAVGPLR